jgi:hypothetical protein
MRLIEEARTDWLSRILARCQLRNSLITTHRCAVRCGSSAFLGPYPKL